LTGLDAAQPAIRQRTAEQLPALRRSWQPVCLDARAAHTVVIIPAVRARGALAAKALDGQLAKRAIELSEDAILVLIQRPGLRTLWRGRQGARWNLRIRRHEFGAADDAARAEANHAVVAEVNVVLLPRRLQGHAHTSRNAVLGR
jgi:hypothetical protein